MGSILVRFSYQDYAVSTQTVGEVWTIRRVIYSIYQLYVNYTTLLTYINPKKYLVFNLSRKYTFND